MKRCRPKHTSQFLAAAVTLAAVLIMLTPLRQGPSEVPSRQAVWLPVLHLGGLADTAMFQRRDVSASRLTASDTPLSRKPQSKTAAQPAP